MGWVLYKRSKFTEAEHYFELAIGPSALPDPEILDHYGDVLYRLGRKAEAQRQWQRTQLRLQTRMVSDDDARLLGDVQRKLNAAAQGKPVDVAPLAGDTQDK
jgi:Tfp pilus assembly protein PilF